MELSNILNTINKNKKGVVFSLIFGLFLGTIYFYIPKKYSTVGSLYITRKIEGGSDYFKYEGYYSQQSAITHTENLLSVLQSTEVQNEILSKLGMPTTNFNLLKLRKDINIKKSSAHIINITVKSSSPEKSREIWNNLVDISTYKLDTINRDNGDTFLKINKVGNSVTTLDYYPIELCLLVGSGISLTIYLCNLILNLYKEKNK